MTRPDYGSSRPATELAPPSTGPAPGAERPWLQHEGCDQRIAELEDLLRRALKDHDAITASLRAGSRTRHLFKASDDMGIVKVRARELDCYPAMSSVLRAPKP